MLEQNQLKNCSLENIVLDLFNHTDRIKEMEQKSKKLSKPNANTEIINNIINIANR